MNLSARLGKIPSFKMIKPLFSGFSIICAFIASLAVLANDTYYFIHFGLNPSIALFLIGLMAGYLPRLWGLTLVVGLLPLTVGMPNAINTFINILPVVMPNPGLDLVGGFFLTWFLRSGTAKFLRGEKRQESLKQLLKYSPWPVGLVIVMITFSTLLAITRNVYLSAASTSFRGVLFNLVHFRPIDWRADYLPLGNWVAYALSAGLIIVVIESLKSKNANQKNAWIFRALMLGLTISSIAGLVQAFTGWGLVDSQLQFRKDAFGYAAIGMQPDLHAFAAHMLLGVVGLWGYFLVCKSKSEKYIIAAIFVLSCAGLIASKSRASLLIAVSVLVVLGAVYFYRRSKKTFLILLAILLLVVALIIIGSGSIPGLAWVGELANQIQSRRLNSISDLGGMMGSRFEIWSAVMNMFSAYPFMGVGEGEFYRLSSNISFARSEFLKLNHGENAHNYFLQVLAENGLIGVIVFAIALISPYQASHQKKIVLPALLGLLSLMLGNVFAHSFLVRENLLLGAALLGLMYSFSVEQQENSVPVSNCWCRGNSLWIGILIVAILLSAAIEIKQSFGKMPFKFGIDCNVKDLRTYPDGWTSGAWEELLPKNATSLELTVSPNRPSSQKQLLDARLEMLVWIPGRGKVPVNTIDYQWNANDRAVLRVDLPKEFESTVHVKSVRLEMSNCYTPRNLGINTDGRRLGVQINSMHWQ